MTGHLIRCSRRTRPTSSMATTPCMALPRDPDDEGACLVARELSDERAPPLPSPPPRPLIGLREGLKMEGGGLKMEGDITGA